MAKIVIQEKIKAFNKVIKVDGDKSLSIRSLLIGSQSYGVCKIKNLPKSEDILSTIEGLKKLGIKKLIIDCPSVIWDRFIFPFQVAPP